MAVLECTSLAASTASLVFPHPAGPVSVTNRESRRLRLIDSSSIDRRRNTVKNCGSPSSRLSRRPSSRSTAPRPSRSIWTKRRNAAGPGRTRSCSHRLIVTLETRSNSARPTWLNPRHWRIPLMRALVDSASSSPTIFPEHDGRRGDLAQRRRRSKNCLAIVALAAERPPPGRIARTEPWRVAPRNSERSQVATILRHPGASLGHVCIASRSIIEREQGG